MAAIKTGNAGAASPQPVKRDPNPRLRARLNNQNHCRSRREEAQISDDLAKDQSLLTSAPTILRHDLLADQTLNNRDRKLLVSEFDPFQLLVSPEPRHLTFGELAGPDLDQLNGFRQRPLAAQIFRDLPIAERLQGGSVLLQTALEKLFGFCDQAATKEFVHAGVDPAAQVTGRAGEAKETRCVLHVSCWTPPMGTLLGEWAATQPDDFDRADDPPWVLMIDSPEGFRVALSQFLKQFRQRCALQFGAQSRISGRRIPQSLKKSLEIKTGPTAEDRHSAARLDLRSSLVRKPRELRGVERFGHFHHINQMLRHTGALGG